MDKPLSPSAFVAQLAEEPCVLLTAAARDVIGDALGGKTCLEEWPHSKGCHPCQARRVQAAHAEGDVDVHALTLKAVAAVLWELEGDHDGEQTAVALLRGETFADSVGNRSPGMRAARAIIRALSTPAPETSPAPAMCAAVGCNRDAQWGPWCAPCAVGAMAGCPPKRKPEMSPATPPATERAHETVRYHCEVGHESDSAPGLTECPVATWRPGYSGRCLRRLHVVAHETEAGGDERRER